MRVVDHPFRVLYSELVQRWLDSLIYEPIRAVLLHASGIPDLVPAPERHGVQKLISATRRRVEDDHGAKDR